MDVESLGATIKEQLLHKFGNLALDFSHDCRKYTTTNSSYKGLKILKVSDPRQECSDLLLLAHTDHEISHKIMLVFTSLCMEMSKLTRTLQNNYLCEVLLFGEGVAADCPDEDLIECVSLFIPQLLEIQSFINRCHIVIEQVERQIEAFYTAPNLGFETKGVHLKPVFEILSELLRNLLVLSIAFQKNEFLQEGFSAFEKALKTSIHDPERFGVSIEEHQRLVRVIASLKRDLLTGKLFEVVISNSFQSKVVVSEIITNVKGRLSSVENGNYQDPGLDGEELMKILCLYTVSFHLGGIMDKKLTTQLWDVRKKIPAVCLPYNNLWMVTKHVLEYLPGSEKIFDFKQVKSADTDTLSFIQKKDSEILKEVGNWEAMVSSWIAKIDEVVTILNPNSDDLQVVIDTIAKSLNMASTLQNTIDIILSLHSNYVPAMSKGVVLAITRYIELADCIFTALKQKWLSILKIITMGLEHLSFTIVSSLQRILKRVKEERKYIGKQEVFSALLNLASRCLNGPITEERRLLARLSLACSCPSSLSCLTAEERSHIGDLLKKLEFLSTFQERCETANDFSFLYWHRTMLSVWLSDFYSRKSELSSLNIVVNRYCDIFKHLRNLKNGAKVQECVVEEITRNLVSLILDPLCRDIELELRLATHSHLSGTEKAIFKNGIPNYNGLLTEEPLRIGDKAMHVSEYVTNYLDRTFYNLTSVASHDWKTYMEMRALARRRFNLYTLDDRLPLERLEQGLDVLEIIRNINIFATHYVYDLFSQCFIERQSESRFLTTIGIRHIANSIRTHGSGIINSAVNHAYLFLRQKFQILSQFLFDDQIKSRLVKDLKMTRENREQATTAETFEKFTIVYPYVKAEKFVRGIKNLGMTTEGRSYLDEFRLLITEVGNVMGYARMLRSGNLHCSASTSEVLPSVLYSVAGLNSALDEKGFSSSTVDAASELESTLENITRNFEGGSDFLQLLVQAFAEAFRDKKHTHLRLFYLIVPPLTISYVEQLRSGKEKLQRKDKENAFFTDDGFVMGLAYILTLLGQGTDFDSLHWFETVSHRYTEALVDVRHQQALSGRSGKKCTDGEKLRQTLSLTIRRLDSYRQEYQLLQYSLVSARALFGSNLSSSLSADKDDNKSISTNPSLGDV
ncbi:WASH complex subunit 4-like isoform X2 [Artemia franciscana]